MTSLFKRLLLPQDAWTKCYFELTSPTKLFIIQILLEAILETPDKPVLLQRGLRMEGNLVT